MVSYLLEIGISLHSVLIGFAFGTNFDDDINYLLIALMIHQFFEVHKKKKKKKKKKKISIYSKIYIYN